MAAGDDRTLVLFSALLVTHLITVARGFAPVKVANRKYPSGTFIPGLPESSESVLAYFAAQGPVQYVECERCLMPFVFAVSQREECAKLPGNSRGFMCLHCKDHVVGGDEATAGQPEH